MNPIVRNPAHRLLFACTYWHAQAALAKQERIQQAMIS